MQIWQKIQKKGVLNGWRQIHIRNGGLSVNLKTKKNTIQVTSWFVWENEVNSKTLNTNSTTTVFILCTKNNFVYKESLWTDFSYSYLCRVKEAGWTQQKYFIPDTFFAWPHVVFCGAFLWQLCLEIYLPKRFQMPEHSSSFTQAYTNSTYIVISYWQTKLHRYELMYFFQVKHTGYRPRS